MNLLLTTLRNYKRYFKGEKIIQVVHTCAILIQGTSVILRSTPFTVKSSCVVETLEALSRSYVTVSTNTKIYVVITLTTATLSIWLL